MYVINILDAINHHMWFELLLAKVSHRFIIEVQVNAFYLCLNITDRDRFYFVRLFLSLTEVRFRIWCLE